MMKTKNLKFLIMAALILAVLGFISIAAAAPGAAPAAAPAAALPEAEEMPALEEVTCTSDGVTQTCELWAKPGTLQILSGVSVNVWGFAASADGPAQVPGPVIRANEGESLRIILHNDVAGQNIALAFPGQDGLVPDLVGVGAGGTAEYVLNGLSAGTFLYEAGLTAEGTRQVAMGLFGPLVIGQASAQYQEVILVFSEIDPDFNANPTSFNMIQYRPQFWLVNGRAFPFDGWIGVNAGSSVLLRYLNAGVEHHSLGLLGLDQTVMAANGETLPFPRGAVAEQLPAGDTREVLIHVPAVPNGTLFPLYNASLHQHNNNQRVTDGTRRTAFGGMLAFFQVSDGPGEDNQGPVASNVAVAPAKTNGLVEVTLTAMLTDNLENVVAIEYFIDTVGIPGGGTPITFAAGNPVTISEQISTAILDSLSGGQHTFYVRGMDLSGNWGAPGSAVLTLDKAGPEIAGLGLNPNPTNGSVSVVVSATADDRATGNSIVIAGEYRVDGGAWMSMDVSPTGATVAGLSATIPVETIAGLPEGSHAVEVRAQDALDNWSLVYGSAMLAIDMTGPSVPSVTLSPNTIDLSQPLPNTIRLDATVTDLASNVVSAEGFIDTVGAQGTGFALYPTDGLFNSTTENAYYNIPGAHFSTLSAGTHTIYVVGKDAAGNWGPAGSADLNITEGTADTTGPVVSNLVITPDPTAGASSVVLTAVATDSQSNVAGAVWFQGTTTRKAKLYAMSAVDGVFDEQSEDLIASINVRNWKAGEYQISVWAYDAKGIWGDFVTYTLVVTK
jgi:FtsP/CotA-like multicopper oxidase with cupredoxin domain